MPSLIEVSLTSILDLPCIFYTQGVVLHAFAVVLLVIVCYWISHLVHLSPLANIPNAHWSSPFAPLWILWNRYYDREIQTVAKAFETKGPIVRLGPAEVAVNVIEGGIKTVHDGGFEKSPWYGCFANFNVLNTFSSLGNDHAIRRRRVSGTYSKAHLHKSRHIRAITSNTLQACRVIFQESADTESPIDFLSLSFGYSIDFMTAMIFGLPQATNFIQDAEKRKKWLALYSQSHPSNSMFWMQELPGLTSCLTWLGFPILPRSYGKAKEKLESWALGLLDAAEQYLKEQKESASMSAGNLPMLLHNMKRTMALEVNMAGRQMLRLDPEKEHRETKYEEIDHQGREINEPFKDGSAGRLELASECLDHIVATRDTFGISMAYVLWQISRHGEAQARIRKELKEHIPKIVHPNTTKEGEMAFLLSPGNLDQLQYLNAVIKESLRLRNTVPTSNPRLTPRNTMTRIGNYDGIPGGVRISAFAWCLHRQEAVFERPEEWNPDRWLLEDRQKLAEMNRWNWTFGSGSRMCLGRHLAWLLIQSTLVMIYTNFTTSVVDDQHFSRNGAFVMGKEGDGLLIQFTQNTIMQNSCAEGWIAR